MQSISQTTFKTALTILSTAFKDNPSVLWVVKKDHKINNRITVLCSFCLKVAIEKKGAFITDDQKGVALLIKSWKRQSPFSWLTGYLRLGQYCIGWNRAYSIIKREQRIQERRPKTRHLYFWMLAVKDHTYGLETIKAIRDFVFAYSEKEKLPIYAETTMKSTLNLYLRYGFEIYDTWETGVEGITVYFIRRDWKKCQ
ncbi:MAG: hypothetical protein KBC56_09660 [Flavobacterium sp.]|nr:hypothetical protein [Flavobacterium sp.]